MFQICRLSALLAVFLLVSSATLPSVALCADDEKKSSADSGDTAAAQQESASADDQQESDGAAAPEEADHGDAGHVDDGEKDHGDKDHGVAGHGGGHGKMPPILSFDPGSAVFNIAIFLGVFAILAKFVWPVILGGLVAREAKIASDLQEAQSANEKAQALVDQYQTQLDEAQSKVQGMLAEARRDAESTKDRIVEEAKAEAKRQTERAVADIETAKKVALSELAGQTSEMAIGVAKQVVGRELKAEDHADLIRKALDSVPSNN